MRFGTGYESLVGGRTSFHALPPAAERLYDILLLAETQGEKRSRRGSMDFIEGCCQVCPLAP